MRSDSIHIVLLSGGSGTRLWPLSNSARSKQFLKVLRDDEGNPESMVMRSVRLLREQCSEAHITVATSEAQVEALELQVSGTYDVSLEPERRDTAPAIMLAAAHVGWEQGASPDSTVIVMPIDTYADPAYYGSVNALDRAVQADAADLVLLGVEPSRPSSKFGYIVPKKSDVDVMSVDRFVEKPDHAKAQALIEQGALWNCGVFAFKLGYLLNIVSEYSQASSYDELRNEYGKLPKISFDYEVVEKAKSVAAIRYVGAWKDLGTWGALCEELREDVSGKTWVDENTCEDVHVINECDMPLVVSGTSHIVVVATADGLLVTSKEDDSNVRELVSRAAMEEPGCERRKWGMYTRIGRGIYELLVSAGKQLYCMAPKPLGTSLTVASGQGELDYGGIKKKLVAGDSVRVEGGAKYSVRAIGDLRLVEVRGVGDAEASNG